MKSSRPAINYYKRLTTLHGGFAKLQNSVRLFLLPDTGYRTLQHERLRPNQLRCSLCHGRLGGGGERA